MSKSSKRKHTHRVGSRKLWLLRVGGTPQGLCAPYRHPNPLGVAIQTWVFTREAEALLYAAQMNNQGRYADETGLVRISPSEMDLSIFMTKGLPVLARSGVDILTIDLVDFPLTRTGAVYIDHDRGDNSGSQALSTDAVRVALLAEPKPAPVPKGSQIIEFDREATLEDVKTILRNRQP